MYGVHVEWSPVSDQLTHKPQAPVITFRTNRLQYPKISFVVSASLAPTWRNGFESDPSVARSVLSVSLFVLSVSLSALSVSSSALIATISALIATISGLIASISGLITSTSAALIASRSVLIASRSVLIASRSVLIDSLSDSSDSRSGLISHPFLVRIASLPVPCDRVSRLPHHGDIEAGAEEHQQRPGLFEISSRGHCRQHCLDG